MRFLLTCIPGFGHFNPLLPLARALKASGHDVAIATAPSFSDAVIRAGFEFIAAGMNWDERRLLETVPELRSVGRTDRGEWMMNRLFLDRLPRQMIKDLLAIVPDWSPDMIISGSFDFGGPLAAERCGLPYATVTYMVRWDRWILKHAIGRSIARLRTETGLPPDPELGSFGRYADLCLAPASWTFERALLRPALTRLVLSKVASRGLPLRQRMRGLRALALQRLFARSLKSRRDTSDVHPNTHFIGAESHREPVARPPAWLDDMPHQPTVFVSFGTVLGGDYPELFDKVVAALAGQPVNLVMTMGGTGDPSRFGAQPSNVRIVSFMAPEEVQQLLPHVDLCINHAGFGSIMEALAHGLPLVLLPLVSDAPMNTQMCLSTGVAPDLPREIWGLSPKGLPVIEPAKVTPSIIREAVMRALHDPSYRDQALAIRKELRERPGTAYAVELLERLVARERPA